MPAHYSSRQHAGVAQSGPPASNPEEASHAQTPPNPTLTAPGPRVTTSSQARPSGPSAQPTSRPYSPTSTTTPGTSAC
jgi:hypothetical protein